MEQVAVIVRRVGQELSRAGLENLYKESLSLIAQVNARDGVQYAEIAGIVETKTFLTKCLGVLHDMRNGKSVSAPVEITDDEAKVSGSTPTARRGRLRNNIPQYTPPTHELAYTQYQEAVRAKGGTITDAEAYRWLHRKYRDLPTFQTWTRYLRGGRRAHSDKKNNPRHGRPLGRSIVRANQIETTRRGFDDFDE